MYQDSEAKSSQYPPPPSYSGPPQGQYSEPPPAQYHGPPPTQYYGPPPAQPPPPGVAYQGATVTIQGPSGAAVYTIPPAMGTKPGQYTCPSCRQVIVTRVEKKASMRTHFFAFLLCAFLLWPCMCIPYCVDSCKSIDHYCPSCNAYIGTYRSV